MSPESLTRLAYVMGVGAAALALYLLLNPYSVTTYYSGPARPLNVTPGGGLVLLAINNTGGGTAYVPVSVGEEAYGVAFINNATLEAPPGLSIYNFSFVKYIYINYSSQSLFITIKSIKILIINKILTVIMVLLFILMFAFLVVGYLYQIVYKTKGLRNPKEQ
ncbi:MAG: hypothetical protein AT711_03500 [Thermoproteus sp. CIS_19]|nr:MAG: hypothetical protein AT711_03500 [Thermoproteus sp. CIS_19]